MKANTLRAHDPRLVRLVAYLRRHLDEPLVIDDLARFASVSPSHLDRVFTRMFGETPRACLRRLRLERAARELRLPGRRILRLSLDAGFSTHEAFTRSFTRHFGCSPAEYRRQREPCLRPRDRSKAWGLALAAGLRRHVEKA